MTRITWNIVDVMPFRAVALGTVLSLISTQLPAQDFAKGFTALQAGEYQLAFKELRPLAELGDPYAQYNLGGMYYNGNGTPQDYAEAAKWWLLAAEQGNNLAQSILGRMYAAGQGVSQDNSEAVKWSQLAAEQGNAQAQTHLGFMYDKGEGVPQNYVEAVKWYQLASEQGNAQAQVNLGFMYDKGKGVLQDNVIAHMWYNIGSAKGQEIGGTNRDKIAKEMTSADISKAQSMARECMSSNYKNCGY